MEQYRETILQSHVILDHDRLGREIENVSVDCGINPSKTVQGFLETVGTFQEAASEVRVLLSRYRPTPATITTCD